jgi:hypothetical protein
VMMMTMMVNHNDFSLRWFVYIVWVARVALCVPRRSCSVTVAEALVQVFDRFPANKPTNIYTDLPSQNISLSQTSKSLTTYILFVRSVCFGELEIYICIYLCREVVLEYYIFLKKL